MKEHRSPTTSDPRALQTPITGSASSRALKLVGFVLAGNATALFVTHPDPNRGQWVFRTGLLALGIGLYVAAMLRDRRAR